MSSDTVAKVEVVVEGGMVVFSHEGECFLVGESKGYLSRRGLVFGVVAYLGHGGWSSWRMFLYRGFSANGSEEGKANLLSRPI
jgi:hypothetical protein